MRILLVLLFALCCLSGRAQPSESGDATVTVFHRPIVVFRAPFLGLSPAERARRTRSAIEEELARSGPGEVTVQQEPQGRVILVDGALALILTPGDVDPLRGETLDRLTRNTVATLSRVIAETREARDRGRLLRSLLWSALATGLFAVAASVVVWVRHAVSRQLAAWALAASQPDAPGRVRLWQPARVHQFADWTLRLLSWPLLAALTYQWLVFVLVRFPRTRAAGEQLGAFVIGVAQRIGDGLLDAAPDLAVAAAIFGLARLATNLLRPMFERVEQGQGQVGWLDRDLARPTRRLVGLAIWLFAVVMAYPYLPGSQTEAFKGVSVLVGLMITLGGSSLVGQAASGLILMYSRTMRIGELVRVGEHEGTVVEMGSFTTRIRTGMGEELTLPNGLVMGSVICNYSRAVQGPGYVVETGVTIGYDTPWRQVEAMLLEAAHRTPGILAQPQPQVLQRALADFYIDYRLVGQAVPETPRARAEVLNTLHANILDVFNEQGVQIMSPHYLGDPPDAKVVPATHPFAAPVLRKAAAPARAVSTQLDR